MKAVTGTIGAIASCGDKPSTLNEKTPFRALILDRPALLVD
jgi:hypothetical protein